MLKSTQMNPECLQHWCWMPHDVECLKHFQGSLDNSFLRPSLKIVVSEDWDPDCSSWPAGWCSRQKCDVHMLVLVGWCGRADCWAVITKANWWPEQTERITLGPGLTLRCSALYLVSFLFWHQYCNKYTIYTYNIWRCVLVLASNFKMLGIQSCLFTSSFLNKPNHL